MLVILTLIPIGLYLALVAAVIAWSFTPAGKKDACLDSGGRWDYAADACER